MGGADLILAMILAAFVTHAWENSKRRSAAAWAAARERAEQKWERRTERMRKARTTGPKDPLWWAFATGWVLSATTAATAASVHGLITGAVAGARGGYRVGREGARKGWSYREAWRQWRNSREQLEVEECQRCGGLVLVEHVVIVPEFGRVCPDCRPSRRTTPRQDAEHPDEQEVIHRRCAWCEVETDESLLNKYGWCATCAEGVVFEDLTCDGTCTNSDVDPHEAEKRGLCGMCGGRGEYVCNFAGRHWHVRCRECDATGRFTPGEAHFDADTSDPEPEQPERIYVQAERMDVNEEHPNNESGGTTMGELVPANTTDMAGTGEGYADTIATLTALSKFLHKAYEEVTSLSEHLTANSLDNDTISKINDLTDMLETAAPMAAELVKHVEQRHSPVADAVASAGGSSNVAQKTWYDQY